MPMTNLMTGTHCCGIVKDATAVGARFDIRCGTMATGTSAVVMPERLLPGIDLAAAERFNSGYRPGLHNAGHADQRTTLTYIWSRDRLSKSPA